MSEIAFRPSAFLDSAPSIGSGNFRPRNGGSQSSATNVDAMLNDMSLLSGMSTDEMVQLQRETGMHYNDIALKSTLVKEQTDSVKNIIRNM